MQDRHRHDNTKGQFWGKVWHEKFWLSLGLVAIATNPLGVALGLGAGAIATVATVNSAQAAALTQWRFDPVNQQLEVTIPPGTTPRYFLLAQPTRIVMDLPNIDMGAVSEQETYRGAVRQIRVSQFQPGLTRIVLELSPDAVLAPGQVQLQQLAVTSSTSARWTLKPLLEAGADNIAANNSPPTAPVAIAPSSTSLSPASLSPASPTPVAASTASSGVTAASRPTVSQELQNDFQGRSPSSLLTTEPASIGTVPEPTNSGLPPQEPGAIEIPVESTLGPSEFPAPANPNPNPTAVSPSRVASDWQIPPALPPALPQTSTTAMVTVPPLGSAAAAQPALLQPAAQPVLPPAPPPVSAPQGQDIGRASPARTSAVEPIQPVAPPRSPVVATAPRNPNVLLPSGTALSLRYPRETALTTDPNQPRQEVLVVDQPVLDVAGNVVFPAGSQVIGRFETSRSGSQFITQAITLNGRNLRLDAESDKLGGDRQVSNQDLLRNSAIGAVGVTVLGVLTGGLGLLGLAAGAATGAATTYLTAPQPTTIQPNQIVEVRLTRDILR